ncbi:UNVERIFIED_CONTAM: Gag-Pol polyprotein [Sesamum radiatum]|uniref:Gag-Pol polyprotein n=1 Tax=Sesamum radiatum TaxID=300843 RepID=A0AAW2L4I0_SESRA
MMADQLAKLASSNQFNGGRRITLLSAAKPMVGSEEEEGKEIEEVSVGDNLTSTWTTPIVRFLTEGILPEDNKEAGKIKLRSARFVLIDGKLYRRGFSSPLLKCLNPDKAEYVLREVHEGSCGNHPGARSLARKVLRLGYYWPTIVKDALSLVQKCSPCQRHANYQHNPAAYMKTLESPCPFDMWGMDIVGKLPRAAGQKEYLIVAVDYFTKWVEAEPLAKIGEKEVMKFIWQNIICRFGIPRVLIVDNGTQFQRRKLKSWLEELKIRQLFTSVNNPQANGQAEVTNRIILQQLKMRLGEKGNWVHELPGVLWAYRTTLRESTQETPFNLVYSKPKPYSQLKSEKRLEG